MAPLGHATDNLDLPVHPGRTREPGGKVPEGSRQDRGLRLVSPILSVVDGIRLALGRDRRGRDRL